MPETLINTSTPNEKYPDVLPRLPVATCGDTPPFIIKTETHGQQSKNEDRKNSTENTPVTKQGYKPIEVLEVVGRTEISDKVVNESITHFVRDLVTDMIHNLRINKDQADPEFYFKLKESRRVSLSDLRSIYRNLSKNMLLSASKSMNQEFLVSPAIRCIKKNEKYRSQPNLNVASKFSRPRLQAQSSKELYVTELTSESEFLRNHKKESCSTARPIKPKPLLVDEHCRISEVSPPKSINHTPRNKRSSSNMFPIESSTVNFKRSPYYNEVKNEIGFFEDIVAQIFDNAVHDSLNFCNGKEIFVQPTNSGTGSLHDLLNFATIESNFLYENSSANKSVSISEFKLYNDVAQVIYFKKAKSPDRVNEKIVPKLPQSRSEPLTKVDCSDKNNNVKLVKNEFGDTVISKKFQDAELKPLLGEKVQSEKMLKDNGSNCSSEISTVQVTIYAEKFKEWKKRISAPATSKYESKLGSRIHSLTRNPNSNLSSRPGLSGGKRSDASFSLRFMSTHFHGSTLSAFENPKELVSKYSFKSVANSFNPVVYLEPENNVVEKKVKFIDFSLLKNPIYLIILFSNSTNAISYTNFLILLPSFALSMEFSKEQGAYLLSIVSCLDLIGRIGGAALSDAEIVPKSFFYISGLFFSGLALAVLPLCTSYTGICTLCGFFGLFSGAQVGVTTLILAEMLGTDRLMATYGVNLFFSGILQLIGPPIFGSWLEVSGSYSPLHFTFGVILMMGASMWLAMPHVLKQSQNTKDDKR